MRQGLLVCCLILGLVSPVLSEESPGRTFDREKLERTRALIAERAEASETPSTATPAAVIDTQSTMVTMAQGLMATLAVLFIGLHIYKRLAGDNAHTASRRMRIVERLVVTKGCTLALVQIDGKEHILATGSESVTFASRREEPPPFQTLMRVADEGVQTSTPLANQVEREVVWQGA